MARTALLALAFAMFAAPAMAALPPQYQRQAELERIIGDPRVEEALKGAPISAIIYVSDDRYEVRGGACQVIVEVFTLPAPAGEPMMVGPRRFDLRVGPAKCD